MHDSHLISDKYSHILPPTHWDCGSIPTFQISFFCSPVRISSLFFRFLRCTSHSSLLCSLIIPPTYSVSPCLSVLFYSTLGRDEEFESQVFNSFHPTIYSFIHFSIQGLFIGCLHSQHYPRHWEYSSEQTSPCPHEAYIQGWRLRQQTNKIEHIQYAWCIWEKSRE